MVGVGALVGFDVGGSDLGAVGAVGVVVICYALGPAILARYLGDLPGLGVVASSLTICAIGYAPFGIPQLPNAMPSQSVVVSVVLLAVVCTAIAFLLLFELVAEIGPVRSTVITYVNPAVAVAAGAIVLSEPITVATMVGFALIIAGSVLATRRSPAPEPLAEARRLRGRRRRTPLTAAPPQPSGFGRHLRAIARRCRPKRGRGGAARRRGRG